LVGVRVFSRKDRSIQDISKGQISLETVTSGGDPTAFGRQSRHTPSISKYDLPSYPDRQVAWSGQDGERALTDVRCPTPHAPYTLASSSLRAGHGAGRVETRAVASEMTKVTGEHHRARGNSSGSRVAAVISLTATALLALAVVDSLLHNALYVIVGLGGAMLATAGGWWIVAKHMPRRAIGFAELLAGIALLVTAIAKSGADHQYRALRIIAVLVLIVIAIGAARFAMVRRLRLNAVALGREVHLPTHPVLICNPRSGGGKVKAYQLIELASSLGIETITLEHGLDLEQLARDAVNRGADCLGMAGGDGSQALVASITVEAGIPYVCIAAGTRNHFAQDLGLNRDNPRQGMYAFRDSISRDVDYATVGNRLFVNNVSLGVYATIVQQEAYREAKVETSRTLLPDLLGRTDRPFDLQFTAPDQTEVDGAFLIMISNNPYVLGPSLDLSKRRRLDAGQLGVFAVTAATGAQAARAVTRLLAGRKTRGGYTYQFVTEEFEVRSRSGRAFVGIDGEALELETPLRFRIHARGLRTLVPRGNPEAALRRQAHDVAIRDLLAAARGVPSYSRRSG
jgi:diacylglycerol kinase family enzyme